jgi:hypothetical protein
MQANNNHEEPSNNDQAFMSSQPQFEEERGEAASDQGAAAPLESQDSLDEPSSGRSIENEDLNHLISARGRGQ